MHTVPTWDNTLTDKLNQLLIFASENNHSPFYRQHFQKHGYNLEKIVTYDNWLKVPFLERKEITDQPLYERIFVPLSEVETTRYSNWSTGRKLLCTPRKFMGGFKSASQVGGGKRQMVVLAGAYFGEAARRSMGGNMMQLHHVQSEAEFPMVEKMFKAFKADTLAGGPTMILAFAQYLQDTELRNQIVCLQLIGERCTPQQRTLLKKAFPKAALIGTYALSEVGSSLGEQCVKSIEINPLAYHFVSAITLYEFVDPKTLLPADPKDQPCELVVTSLQPNQPFPNIRYRTGDLIEIAPESCDCGQTLYLVQGRDVYDLAEWNGMQFFLPWLEAAVATCDDILDERFEFHIRPGSKNNQEGVIVEALVVPRNDSVSLAEAQKRLSGALLLSKSKTYTEFCQEGAIGPLVVKELTDENSANGPNARKQLRLFSYLP